MAGFALIACLAPPKLGFREARRSIQNQVRCGGKRLFPGAAEVKSVRLSPTEMLNSFLGSRKSVRHAVWRTVKILLELKQHSCLVAMSTSGRMSWVVRTVGVLEVQKIGSARSGHRLPRYALWALARNSDQVEANCCVFHPSVCKSCTFICILPYRAVYFIVFLYFP